MLLGCREYDELIIEPDGRPPKDNVEMISDRFIIDDQHFIQEIRSLHYHRFKCEKNSNGYMQLVSSRTKSLEWTLSLCARTATRQKLSTANLVSKMKQLAATVLSLPHRQR